MSELYKRLNPFLGDKQKLIERMAGRMDLWEECVLLFPGPELIEKIDDALCREDSVFLYQEVHRLKGNLANFGFDRAAEKALAVLQAITTALTPISISFSILSVVYFFISSSVFVPYGAFFESPRYI